MAGVAGFHRASGPEVCNPTVTQQKSALCFATDGSAKQEKPGQAGWGYTACLLSGTPAEVLDAAASTTGAAPALYEESGRVVTNDKA